MSRTMLLVSTALLASSFLTQAFAEEVKYDVQNCFAGPIQITQEEGLVAGSYAVLGIAPGTVTAHLARAIATLRGELAATQEGTNGPGVLT